MRSVSIYFLLICVKVLSAFDDGFVFRSSENFNDIVITDFRKGKSIILTRDIENLRISAQKCEEYRNLTIKSTSVISLSLNPKLKVIAVPKCDTTVSLIVGGEKARVGEFPHMAALGYYNDQNVLEFRCGGTLISNEYVLTASHCYAATIPDKVRLGRLNMTGIEKNGAEYTVEKFIKHPDYNKKTKVNDLALIKLKEKVTFTNYIKPACLWQNNDVQVKKAIATGYGATGFVEENSNYLMKVSLDFFDQEQCKQAHENRFIKLTDNQFCAGDLNNPGKRDTCQGDSGGPLQVGLDNAKCIYQILGVTSFGKVCGVAPGVYTFVYPYLNWIEGIVWPK